MAMSQIFRSAAFEFCSYADTPISLGIWLRIKYLSFDNLPVVTPSDYLTIRGRLPFADVRKFRLDAQALALVSKSDLPTSRNRRKAAFETAIAGELQCYRTNLELSCYNLGLRRCDKTLNTLISRAQGLISKILGELDIAEVISRGGFGPGADLSTDSFRTTVYDKVLCLPTVTPLASQYIQFLPARLFLTKHLSVWDLNTRLPTVRIVDSNRSTTVPKNLKTDRFIAIEPSLNVFFQKGVGSHIRHRLKAISGVDLNDSLHNASLALKGSKDESFATIDLQNASDTLSYETVKMLLPIDWFMFLDNIRSHKTDNILLSKFSSMGNGFTFELESLIFYALSIASGSTLASVFGDDIAIEAEFVPRLSTALKFFGFVINVEKTFTTGFFKESCGYDFFYGENTRPIYFRSWDIRTSTDIDRCNRVFDLISNLVGTGAFIPRRLYSIHSALSAEFKEYSSPRYSSGLWNWFPKGTVPTNDKFGREGSRYKLVSFKTRGFRPKDYDAAVICGLQAPFTDYIVPRKAKTTAMTKRKTFVPEYFRYVKYVV